MPRVSIIMPAYNAAEFLAASVSSVISQTFKDWELLIVNDGSTDATAEIAGEFADSDSRIRVIYQENAGVSSARNKGISLSVGDFIAFLDADDAFCPDFLADMLAAVDENDADCAACGHLRAYPDGKTEPEPFPLPEGVSFEEDIMDGLVMPLLSDRLSSGLFNGFVWRYLFDRKKIIENNITFSGAYLEDELFLIEYFSLPAVLAVAGKNLYLYTQNPKSATRRYMPDCVDTFLFALARKRELVSRFDIPVPSWWELNTAWAGLLIAIGNIYAPGNNASFREKVKQSKSLMEIKEFSRAVSGYKPAGMGKNKTIVAKLYTMRLYSLLGLLYLLKNGK